MSNKQSEIFEHMVLREEITIPKKLFHNEVIEDKKVLFSKLLVALFYSLALTLWVILFCYWAFGRISSSDNFAPFIHSGNIIEISKELNDAIYHIERNGNAKIILLDLSIKLTRLLHIKEAS